MITMLHTAVESVCTFQRASTHPVKIASPIGESGTRLIHVCGLCEDASQRCLSRFSFFR